MLLTMNNVTIKKTYHTSNNQRSANAGEDDSYMYLFFSVMKDLKAHVEKGFALRGLAFLPLLPL